MILKELLAILHEEENKPIELKDLLEFFPGTYEKAIRKLWGSDRLVYHGMKFFENNDLGEAYEKADKAVAEAIKSGVDVDVRFDLNDKDDLGFSEFEFTATIEDDPQEVYLGYSPKLDQLFIGVDASLNEDDFNEAWDRKFKQETGSEFDLENEQHSALFDEAWKLWLKSTFRGVLFSLDIHGSKFHAEVVQESADGFYKGVHRSANFKALGLVDIRLD